MISTPGPIALVVVDMQRYYTEPESAFQRYFRARHPGAMDYITDRCQNLVIPNTSKLLRHWRETEGPVIFLRLCGTLPDRSDLHPHFLKAHRRALEAGYEDCYPLTVRPLL